jgi:drug/metabolite transporter (DMT)-like permease
MVPRLFFAQSALISQEVFSRRKLVTLILLSISSGIMLTLHFSFWFQSLRLTTVSAATVLANTHPIFILVLGLIFLKEKVKSRAIIWILVAMLGTVFLTVFDAKGFAFDFSNKGNLYALLAALFFSVYLIIGRYVRKFLSMTYYTFIVYLVAFILFFLYSSMISVPLGPFPVEEYFLFVALAIFPTLLGHSLFNWSLKYVQTASISIIMLLEPVVATILALVLLKEVPGLTTILLSPLIVFAIYKFSILNNGSNNEVAANSQDLEIID